MSFVTREHAMGMYCPWQPTYHGKMHRCIAEQCMAWRDVILYASYVSETLANNYYKWSTTPAQNAQAVECGYCGNAGAPYLVGEITAPLGVSPESLIGYDQRGHKKTVRSATRMERDLMKRRGIAPEDHEEGPVSAQKFYRELEKRGK